MTATNEVWSTVWVSYNIFKSVNYGWLERLRNDLFCIKWDEKPTQSTSQSIKYIRPSVFRRLSLVVRFVRRSLVHYMQADDVYFHTT